MDLHGSMEINLTAAIRSARRLRGKAVHPDTIGHWADLLAHARRDSDGQSREPFRMLMLELEKELLDREH